MVQSATIPAAFDIKIGSNMVPTVTAQFQSSVVEYMTISGLADDNIVFTTQCTQELAGSTASCTESPTSVIATIDETALTGVGDAYTDKTQAGFTTDGRVISGYVSILLADGTYAAEYTEDVYAVGTITDDAWSYNSVNGAGEFALGIGSTLINELEVFSKSGFILETGPVADQSFAGGQTPDATLQSLLIGGGVTSETYDKTSKTTLTLTPDADGAFPLQKVGFGKVAFADDLPASGYHQALGFLNVQQTAYVTPNFVGLGLPYLNWLQVANLLYKVDLDFNDELVCTEEQGGMCHLTSACSTYTTLWSDGWTFKFDLGSSNEGDYILMPLGALAVDNAETGQCDIYLQYLDSNKHTESDKVVLGALILQQYKAWWYYDLSANTESLYIQLSDSCSLNDAYIGSASITSTSSPFGALADATPEVLLTPDPYHYRVTVGGSLGFQGSTTFYATMLGPYIMTWDTDCMIETAGTRFVSCDNEPINAELYFEGSIFETSYTEPYKNQVYGGYNTSGSVIGATVCLGTSDVPYFCSIYNRAFYSAEAIYSNDWNPVGRAYSGIVGFGIGSPIWDIFSDPDTMLFDVYLTNFNDWTWAQEDYTAQTSNCVMNLMTFSDDYDSTTDVYTRIKPYTTPSYLFKLEEIGFGKVLDEAAATEYYDSVLNFDTDPATYGAAENTTDLDLNFRGLGLPSISYAKFVNLLSVATNGEATCLQVKGGYCVLTQECSSYSESGLWDYDFKIKFDSSDDNYMRVPLASFAANFEQEGGVCVIFVEYLDANNQDGQSIMLGGMFFQSIYAQYTMGGVSSVQVDLFVNKNALSSTYMGSKAFTQGISPFVPDVAEITTDTVTSQQGKPTFIASVTGIEASEPYFLIDFESTRTVVWATDCQTSGIGSYPSGDCSSNPTLTESAFDGSNLQKTGSFTNTRFSGYVVSGSTYTAELCFGSVNCKAVDVYAASEISQDNWNFNQDAGYGIIGMGPGSYIWEGFVDPETLRTEYSIALARLGFFGAESELGASSTVQTNITFGSADDDWYVENSSPYVYMPSLANYSYALDQFAFGIVYTNDDGSDKSEFFYDLGNSWPVQFSTNFKGIGLPSNLYSQFETLLEYVTGGDVECQNTVDGVCALPGACEDYAALTEYYFKLTFSGEVTGNYMRVPLQAFSYTVLLNQNSKCVLEVQYLNEDATQSQDIVLGGMYYEEFFGVFQNDYHSRETPDQATKQYVGRNSIYGAYIGNEQLSVGTNPFIPTPQPSDDGSSGLGTAWIVVIALICGALVGFLGFLLYKYRMAQLEAAKVRGSNVVYTNGGNVNLSEQTSKTDEVIPDEEKKLLDV